jgi:hypothetical protein
MTGGERLTFHMERNFEGEQTYKFACPAKNRSDSLGPRAKPITGQTVIIPAYPPALHNKEFDFPQTASYQPAQSDGLPASL